MEGTHEVVCNKCHLCSGKPRKPNCWHKKPHIYDESWCDADACDWLPRGDKHGRRCIKSSVKQEEIITEFERRWKDELENI